MKICKVRPTATECRMCLDTDEYFGVVTSCSNCAKNRKVYELLQIGVGLFSNYALVQDSGRVEKVSIDRLYDIREVENEQIDLLTVLKKFGVATINDLAKKIYEIDDGQLDFSYCGENCPNVSKCDELLDSKEGIRSEMCIEGIKHWLESEAEPNFCIDKQNKLRHCEDCHLECG